MVRPRRVTPAKNYQRRDDRTRKTAEASQSALRGALRRAFLLLRQSIKPAAIADDLRHGRTAAMAAADAMAGYREALKEPFSVIGAIIESMAAKGATQINRQHAAQGKRPRYGHFRQPASMHYLPPHLRKDVSLEQRFTFDRFDAQTQARIRSYQDQLIRELGSGAQDAIETMILNGVRAGIDFTEIARNVRSTVSLTGSQAQSVINYRAQLEAGDGAARNRALRDASYDGRIGDLSADEIDAAVDAYAANYLDYRADTIARTESLRAANTGLREAYRQAADRGSIPDGAVTRRWLVDLDERTCPVCMSIPEMNDEGVGLNQPFQSEDGPIDDPPVHPSCRCTVEYETDLSMVPDDEDASTDDASSP